MVKNDDMFGNENLHTNPNATPTPFAEKEETVSGEPKKKLRGKMLKKLMKYDFKALFRFLLPALAVLFFLSVLCAVAQWYSMRVNVEDKEFDTAYNGLLIVGIVYALCACGVAGICFFNTVSHYQKNLFSDEGYLTLTLPATPEEQVFSKVLSGFITVLLTIVALALSTLVADLPCLLKGERSDGIFTYALNVLDMLFVYSFDLRGVNHTVALVELAIFALLSLLFQLQVIDACICIGQTRTSKNRTMAAVRVFFLYVVITQVCSVIGPSIFGGLDLKNSQISSSATVHIAMWVLIVLACLGNVIAFLVQRSILKKKVNLA